MTKGIARVLPQKQFSNEELRRPQQSWLYDDPDKAVHVLFITRPCRWNRCFMCSLPMMSSDRVQLSDILAQIDSFCEEVLTQPGSEHLRVLAAGNNGSILDPATFPPSALLYLIAKVRRQLPGIRKYSLITRPEWAPEHVLKYLRDEMLTWGFPPEEPAEVEIAIGLEAINPKATKLINKGFTENKVTVLARLLQRINDSVGKESKAAARFSLKAYFLLKPPGLTDEESVADLADGLGYLNSLSQDFGLHATMHLNPMYVAEGTPLVEDFNNGRYLPPDERFIARALLSVDAALFSGPTSLCLGLSDEGLAVKDGSFAPTAATALWLALRAFNADRSLGKQSSLAAIRTAYASNIPTE
jgi:radical SAM enzyme (TIGR01210 family)